MQIHEEKVEKDIKNIEKKKGVRVATVDNYQGEESDIVLISLVRSNENGDIGFMKEPQRVNVMLSRARHAMIIVGNSETLCRSRGKQVWQPILNYLHGIGSLSSNGLPSYCQLHPKDLVYLCKPCDFRNYRPNGGCMLKCVSRMECGHTCPQKCHPIDKEHKFIKCFESCVKVPDECPNLHRCKKFCWQKCGPCMYPMNVALPCGHVKDTSCHIANNAEAISKLMCNVKVSVTIPHCNHNVIITCFESKQEEPFCPHVCGMKLSCGHLCVGDCGKCFVDNFHKQCKQKCERSFFCGHLCGRNCHSNIKCENCSNPCTVQCTHSRCPKKCSEVCASCKEHCSWTCEHQGQCEMPCGAPCTRLPCDKRCSKTLTCGHRCPSVCGEVCPDQKFCQQCGSKRDAMVDYIAMNTYAEHDADSDPLVFLPCGHFSSISTLDGHMEMERVYGKDMNSNGWCGTLSAIDYSTTTPKSCLECRSVIHSVFRYGRVLRYAELKVLERKHALYVENLFMSLPNINHDNNAIDLLTLKSYKKYFQDALRAVERGPLQEVKKTIFYYFRLLIFLYNIYFKQKDV
jgi:hypothetical protein